MNKSIISINNLTKRFGNNTILNNVTLDVNRGESIAIIGNNGTGKSTFIRMIAGLINKSGGEILYNDNLKFSYIPEHYSKLNITIDEYISSMAELDKLPIDQYKLKSEELYKLFFLKDMINTPMKHLSKGSLQKVAVIQSFLIKPDVLLLDEPLSGQDIKSQENFIKYVQRLKGEGVTVILACHEPYLVRKVCEKVYKIENQRLVQLDMKLIEEDRYCNIVFELSEDILKSYSSGEVLEEENSVKFKVSVEESNNFLIHMLNKFNSNPIFIFMYSIVFTIIMLYIYLRIMKKRLF